MKYTTIKLEEQDITVSLPEDMEIAPPNNTVEIKINWSFRDKFGYEHTGSRIQYKML